MCDRGDDRAFPYQNHPNVNKALFMSDSVIALKQADRAFPAGAPVGVLKWRYTNKDDDAAQVPLMLTCWPEDAGGGVINVNLEYTLQREDITLQDVIVTVPLCVRRVAQSRRCTGAAAPVARGRSPVCLPSA